ncbi:type I DNA topoisomerase, partial [Ruminococcus flavefaciens]|uniref:type I DNA topoisomerase n=1 Tax=Ruminococcus flavefaciens TaxID=1265 RepID=UPI001565A002
MSDLVIVESPAKAKTIQKYLGPGYEVIASMGHVRDLPKSKMGVDKEHDFQPQYTEMKGKEDVIKELKKRAEKCDKVYLATDPDREGEAISWHIAQMLKLDMNDNNRVAFNEITKSGVRSGMSNPHKIDVDLVNAQQARRILDRLVGYELSPFLWKKVKRGLSAGRVQSVAVRLVVDRENEIRAFVPKEYWSIDAKFTAPGSRKVFDASLVAVDGKKLEIPDQAEADGLLARLEGAEYTVTSVKKRVTKKQPAPPFITSTMQQEASRKLGFSAKRTMKAAQELYEGVDVEGVGAVGLITYMRTDSLRISAQAVSEVTQYINEKFGEKYLPAKPRFFKSRSNAQDGHEAIRPAVPSLTPDRVKSSLTSDQYKLYSLIWKRFIASLMASCVQNTVKAEITGANDKDAAEGKYCVFAAAGYSVKFDGFTTLYEESTDDDEDESKKQLPELSEGDIVKLKELVGNQHFTQPPARYTEASLIKAMEENGIGRPSTYATIITTITKRGYVKRQAKLLVPTELGEATTGLLKEKFPKIVNAKFTASMENQLDEVGEGKSDYVAMLHTFYDEFDKTLQKAKDDMKDVKIQLEEDITDIPCEKCGRLMVIKTGRFGRFLACPGYPECKNAKPLITK